MRVLVAPSEARVRDQSRATVGQYAYDWSKRVIDIVLSVVFLIGLGPIWLVVAAIIRLTSDGPVIYRQHRVVGRFGREFTVYKFRTMVNKNDDTQHQQAIARFVTGEALAFTTASGFTRPIYKLTQDERITRVGRLLRRCGLDEVPQFVNVLRGEMSLVGPRPPLYYEYAHYTDRERQRVSVLPGITGLYQVRGRSSVPFQRMIELDLAYVARRSIWLDLAIIARTPLVMLSGKGAH